MAVNHPISSSKYCNSHSLCVNFVNHACNSFIYPSLYISSISGRNLKTILYTCGMYMYSFRCLTLPLITSCYQILLSCPPVHKVMNVLYTFYCYCVANQWLHVCVCVHCVCAHTHTVSLVLHYSFISCC